jgi:hypothetical protein
MQFSLAVRRRNDYKRDMSLSPRRSANLLRTLLVLSACIFAPDQLIAECGDYVTTRGQKPMQHMPSDSSHATSPTDSSGDHSSGKTCSGPACKQQAPLAPLPQAPTKTHIPNDPAAWNEVALLATPVSRWHRQTESLFLPQVTLDLLDPPKI